MNICIILTEWFEIIIEVFHSGIKCNKIVLKKVICEKESVYQNSLMWKRSTQQGL